MSTRRTLLTAAVLLIAAGSVALAQSDEIEIVHVRGPVYLLAGVGGNITLSAGPDGVLLVDSGSAPMSSLNRKYS